MQEVLLFAVTRHVNTAHSPTWFLSRMLIELSSAVTMTIGLGIISINNLSVHWGYLNVRVR